MEIFKKEAGTDIKELYHMTVGSYSAESFEEMISQDLNEIVSALKKEK
jgi:zinc transport system substrate-binding protein